MAPRSGTREELAEFLVGRHPSTVAIFRHFTYAHLPTHLQRFSAPVCALACQMLDLLPDGPELTAGLRKLLEAKDCLTRAGVELQQSITDTPVELVDDPLDLKTRLEANAAELYAAGVAAHDAAAAARGDTSPIVITREELTDPTPCTCPDCKDKIKPCGEE
jgi:hypothetical protein